MSRRKPRCSANRASLSGRLPTRTPSAPRRTARSPTPRPSARAPYYFQRNSPLNPLDDLTTNASPPPANLAAATSNLQLFQDLLNRGNLSLPGCSATFAAKYPGAAWTQLVLEIADSIHALNAVAPSGNRLRAVVLQ